MEDLQRELDGITCPHCEKRISFNKINELFSRKEIEIGFTLLTDGERALYILQEDDAHMKAEEMGLKRKLTDDELADVQNGLQWGLGECADDVMRTAIEEALKNNR